MLLDMYFDEQLLNEIHDDCIDVVFSNDRYDIAKNQILAMRRKYDIYF
jgi:hypothetical protein